MTVVPWRLAAQRLAPDHRAGDVVEAARAVCGVQAQDVRAAGLALRARVPGLTREEVDASGLVRVWTVRGTLHLVAPEDVPWLHAVCAPRFLPRYERLLEQRGQPDLVRDLLDDALAVMAGGPRSRPEILEALAEAGHPPLNQGSLNIFMPWIVIQGLVAGTPDGRWVRTDPPEPVDRDEALATMARRYVEGYGPAGAADLAAWSGLPLGQARRALEAAGPVDEAEPAGSPPRLAECVLLGAFDTSMLGWADRAELVGAEHDREVLPGGGMLRPVVLAGPRAVGTWRLPGSGRRRELEVTWFGDAPSPRALAAEAADVGRFLDLEVVTLPRQ